LEKNYLDKQGFAYSYHFEYHHARNHKLLHIEFEGLDNPAHWQEVDNYSAGYNAYELRAVWCFEYNHSVVESASARFQKRVKLGALTCRILIIMIC
jgi:hypothetical protein